MNLPSKSAFHRENILLCSLLLFLTLGTFCSALRNGYVIMDDPDYVTDNSMVKAGLTWSGVIYAFTANVLSNWHPLTMLSHMADCQIFGLNPWGHHLTSVCFHALNTMLVFLVLQKLTTALWRSFFVALFFGLHPLHVESVAWAAERKDVLSTFFALLTLMFYADFAARKCWRDYWIALGLFACGLMCKSMLVTLPCALLLVDFWPLNRWEKPAVPGLLLEKIPFFLLSLAASLIALVTQKTAVLSLSSLPASMRIENAFVSYARYLGKLFYPVNLAAFYPYPHSWSWLTVIGSVILFAVISLTVIVLVRRQPYLFMGWFWFVGILVPVIGLVQAGTQAMADRYTYLPSVGIFIALIWFATELTGSWRLQKIVLPTTGLIMASGYAVLTWQQVHYWHDSETLLHHTIAVTHDNSTAHFILAEVLRDQKRYAEDVQELREGLQIGPDTGWLHNQLASDLEAAGKPDEAINEYKAAMQLSPESAEAGNDLGMALGRQGRYDEAIRVYQFTLQSHPKVEVIHLNLGNALVHAGKLPEAEAEFKQALALNPNDVDAHNNLGVMLFQSHQLDAAREQFQAVLKLNPNNADASRNLAIILNLKNRAPAPAP